MLNIRFSCKPKVPASNLCQDELLLATICVRGIASGHIRLPVIGLTRSRLEWNRARR